MDGWEAAPLDEAEVFLCAVRLTLWAATLALALALGLAGATALCGVVAVVVGVVGAGVVAAGAAGVVDLSDPGGTGTGVIAGWSLAGAAWWLLEPSISTSASSTSTITRSTTSVNRRPRCGRRDAAREPRRPTWPEARLRKREPAT